MKRFRPVIIIAIVIAAAVFIVPRYLDSTTVVAKTGIETSGFIEAVSVNIAPETGGRITAITVNEGDAVKAGDKLVTLDGALIAAQRQQAEINLNVARANVIQATLARDNAKKAWENARDVQLKIALVNLEQTNNIFNKITYPYTYSTFAFDVPAAVAAVNEAQLQLAEAQKWLAEGPDSANYASALDNFRKALDNLTTAQERLLRGEGVDLFLDRRIPVAEFFTLRTAQLEADKARLAVQSTTASVDQAQTTYMQATNAIDIAGEQVKLGEAALNVLDVQMAKLTISSPISGVVAAKNVEVGEIAQPGTPVLTVTQLGNVTLTVYVPESQIGLVMLGQSVQVAIDSYPGESFTGKVIYISPRASFTPGNITLKDEREKTVFAVKISLANPGDKMKPGMPADAVIFANAQG
jgi:HlyD family secretion protein